MTLNDLEPYLQKSADASILVLHYADKISSRQQQRDNVSLRSHLSDSVPGSHRHFEEETTRRPPQAIDHPSQQNPSSSSHDHPNVNILNMTAEQLSCELAQFTDRSNFCAGEPPVETFNMEMTESSQVRQSRPEQSYLDEYQGTPTLPPTVHQAILPANRHNSLQQLTHATTEVTSPTLTFITNAFQVLQCLPSTIPCHQRRQPRTTLFIQAQLPINASHSSNQTRPHHNLSFRRHSYNIFPLYSI